MEFVKKGNNIEVNGVVLKSFYEKKSDKRWFHIPEDLVPVLNRQLIGMKAEMFANAEEGHVWNIEPKQEPIVRNMAGSPKKEKPNAEHWSNYLSEEDKKLYDELEKKGQEARKKAYEENSKQKQIEKLKAQLAALEAELAQM